MAKVGWLVIYSPTRGLRAVMIPTRWFDRPAYHEPHYDPPLATEPSPVKPSGETSTGDNQWFDISFRRGECERVGKEHSRGWADVDGRVRQPAPGDWDRR